MYTISYRPALHHPVYKGGYFFVVFWALLDVIMSMRHYALYDGVTPAFFHVFVVLAILLPLLKRTITIDWGTNKATYRSNIPFDVSFHEIKNPCFAVDRDRKIGTVIITTDLERFDSKITWSTDNALTEIESIKALKVRTSH